MKRNDVDFEKLSPMMKQYIEIKNEYPEELLFFRLGDFYELFFEDGITASKELELTLTGKNAGLSERIPMCGVPFHSVKPYLEKLIDKGYKVAICEQLEDPKTTKGMVKRGVVEVLSKGTIADYELLSEHDNSYIASVLDFNYIYMITYADISTGVINSLSITHDLTKLISELLSLNVKEVILENNLQVELIDTLKNNYGIEVSISDKFLEEKYEKIVDSVSDARAKMGVKHLLYYLVVRELKILDHIDKVNVINKDDYLIMDVHTIRNLELVETLRLKERTYSLIWLLDKTKTAMGSRLLKNWLLNPLKNVNLINERYDKIETLNNEFILKDELRNKLDMVYDIERLCGKITCGNINARDLLQLKTSLRVFPDISKIIKDLKFNYEFKTFDNLYELLEKGIYENPPVSLKEGYLIKDGYNKELDELKKVRSGGKDFLANFEKEVKEQTGIKNLKVGYNKVFGYYIEVSKGQASYVKDEFKWERRQTLSNCERYISPLLKEKESLILNAEENIIELEYNLFLEIKDKIKSEILDLKKAAYIISELDAITSLAHCAEEYNFVRPTFSDEFKLIVRDGRHPVVEKVIKDEYVPNDIVMDSNINTLLITGPNMSGKSTYMRQLAIIVIMAQMGSFVPAKSATLPLIDQIFTRIGASDDLVSGSSTFMVEMTEAKNAIVNATKNSLILFDELGRGTATFDGMSLAEAILEYITKHIGCKTLFSTHYHELTSLEKVYPSIKNVHVRAYEENEKIVFLHKVKDGAIDKSYGIHVAKLAGMPDELIKRADEILKKYENNPTKKKKENNVQLSMPFDNTLQESNKILEEIDRLDILNTTPIDALNILYKLKEERKKH